MTKALQRHSEFMRPELGDFDQNEYAFPPLPKSRPRDTIVEDVTPEDVNPGDPYPPYPGGLDPENSCPCCFQYFDRGCRDKYWSGGQFFLAFDHEHTFSPLTHFWTITGDYNPLTTLHTVPCDKPMTWRCAQTDEFWFQYVVPPAGYGFESVVELCYNIAGVCRHCAEYIDRCVQTPCCEDPGHVAMTFDDANTPDTVAAGSSVGIVMKDGCAPYKWTVSGTGFSFASSVTSGPTNNLVASESACGSATVTCTDECETSASAQIRNTTGTWTFEGSYTAVRTNGSFLNCCDDAVFCSGTVYYIIEGNTRFVIGMLTRCCDNWITVAWGDPTAGSPRTPPCGTPIGCGLGTCTCGGAFSPPGNCSATSTQNELWTC